VYIHKWNLLCLKLADVDFEKKIADFMGTLDSILYSYGLATTTSVIPAFCKAGDLIIA
jgi:serine palmitoyltransferase